MSNNFKIAEKLRKYIPGGAHTYSKGDDQFPEIAPKCIERGAECYVWDADGKKYIDWSMGLTSIAFGHANSEINSAAIEAMSLGHNFQRPSVTEALAAERFIHFLKDRGEMVKFAKNGSTVTTAAMKLARAYTGRELVAICAEHPFFSYDDWFIGSTKCSWGVPAHFKEATVKFSYNNLDSVKRMFEEQKGKIAGLILEPVKFERPSPGFLRGLEDECKKNGTVLIYDEMVTGFKWHAQGAAKYYGGTADLYTWGKGLANGHSVCALTGRRDIMELGGINHDRPRVFLTSTTHGAEIPQLAALLKVLDILDSKPTFFQDNWEKGKFIKTKLASLVDQHKLNESIEFIGEDCFFAINIKKSGSHKPNVARTFLLQELIKRGQLFQGLFYPTVAHSEEAISYTMSAWNDSLPIFSKFLSSGHRNELIGEPMKPVFRTFNSCECLSAEDCKKCEIRLNEADRK